MVRFLISFERKGDAALGRVLLLAVIILLAPLLGLADEIPKSHAQPPSKSSVTQDIEVPAPPLTEGIFPCTACHDNKTLKPNANRRSLGMHDEVQLKHGPESRWCLDCHDMTDRNKLHLVSGERIEFTTSYLLCGQCHGDKFRDWRSGIHGKRTGRWDGKKQYLLCVHCHNPHAPRFQALQPMPKPKGPGDIKLRRGGAR